MTRRQQLGTDEEAKKRQQQDGTDGDGGKGKRRGKGRGKGKGKGRGKGGKKVASPKSKTSPKAKASPKGKAKAKASPKSKAKATAAKSKPKASPSKTPKEPEPEKVKREGGGKRLSKGQEGEQPKKAGGQESARWVPTEGVALKKFNSIRSVFMECVQPRLQSPSSFQKLFFKICSQAFKHGDVTDDSPEADFVALAELQVDELFQQDVVRSSSKFVTILCLLVIRSPCIIYFKNQNLEIKARCFGY